MQSFGDLNKQDITKMNPNTLQGRGKIRRDILAHVLIFGIFFSPINSILWLSPFSAIYGIGRSRDAWGGGGNEGMDLNILPPCQLLHKQQFSYFCCLYVKQFLIRYHFTHIEDYPISNSQNEKFICVGVVCYFPHPYLPDILVISHPSFATRDNGVLLPPTISIN